MAACRWAVGDMRWTMACSSHLLHHTWFITLGVMNYRMFISLGSSHLAWWTIACSSHLLHHTWRDELSHVHLTWFITLGSSHLIHHTWHDELSPAWNNTTNHQMLQRRILFSFSPCFSIFAMPYNNSSLHKPSAEGEIFLAYFPCRSHTPDE